MRPLTLVSHALTAISLVREGKRKKKKKMVLVLWRMPRQPDRRRLLVVVFSCWDIMTHDDSETTDVTKEERRRRQDTSGLTEVTGIWILYVEPLCPTLGTSVSSPTMLTWCWWGEGKGSAFSLRFLTGTSLRVTGGRWRLKSSGAISRYQAGRDSSY